MKFFTPLILILIINYSFSQNNDTLIKYNLDTTFYKYLNNLKESCLNKDTANLHKLLGDEAVGFSCYGAEMPDPKYDTDWLIFSNHFDLANNPNESDFWDLFLKISKDGFYFDQKTNTYEVPSSHYWKGPYFYGAAKFKLYEKVFISDSVEILVGNQISTATKQKIKTSKIIENQEYPYRFTFVSNDLSLCYENEKEIGFVSNKDIIYWNFHLAFEKRNNNWTLTFYEVCD
ncbi:MAG: hypothetical protein WC389_12400 [Lutibacter sp.]|jgi:hypothetical protein